MQIDGIMLFVAELETMVAFYRDGLGLQPNDTARGDGYVELRSGDITFALHQMPRDVGAKPSAAPREATAVKPILTVDDLHTTRERLTAIGATILDRPWGSWDFADPEGNVFGVRTR